MVLRLDKEKIARCFLRSLNTYDKAAEVQNRLVERLLQALDSVSDSAFQSVFEIGCCTGTLTEQLCSRKPVKKIYCNDLVPEFENAVRNKLARKSSVQMYSCFGDIEELHLPSGITLVISGATFQWLRDLPSFLKRLGSELSSGTFFAFSLFGPGTLKEFSSLTEVELNYIADKDLQGLLMQDFEILRYESFLDTLYFQTLRELFNHIRDTGVGGVSEYTWNKNSLQAFEKSYTKNFVTEKGFPVSYSSSCFVARRR